MELKMNDNGNWERRELPPAPGSDRQFRDSLDRNYRYEGPDRNKPQQQIDTVPASVPKTTASTNFVGFLFQLPTALS